MLFEWDDRKRESNLKKHGIDFVAAMKMFSNPIIERSDDREYYGEERWIAIGRWRTTYMVVVYTWRGGKLRIISAWKAGKNDQENYHVGITG